MTLTPDLDGSQPDRNLGGAFRVTFSASIPAYARRPSASAPLAVPPLIPRTC
jgi:hypothetical protein